LRQTLEIASKQNPDITLARLDEARAQEGITVAKDPFYPHLYAGSGAAYTYGYPNSIEGSAPSIVEVRTVESLFNRPKSYAIATARELARGAGYAAQAKTDEVAYQAADLFLTASLTEHEAESFNNQVPSLQKVVEASSAGVAEGSQLPLDLQRAKVNLAATEQRLSSDRSDADYYEMQLAIVLGYSAADRVKPVDSPFDAEVPASESDASDEAIRNNRELKQIQSNVLAKELDIKANKSARLPQVDLVAQYALFAKYNYEQYFQKFQRNNAQLGASFTVPLLIGPASRALVTQDSLDLAKLRIQMYQTRNRIMSATRRSYEQWQKTVSIRDLSRMQLDLARQELTVLLAQNGEGRVPMSQVEQARLEEGNRWIALYDAETQVTRAKLAILREIGGLMASVRQSQPENKP
jgi:outer membrane protein TolC